MALKGVKVLEFAGLAPAPFCGMILADFGANVIRVDRTGSGGELDCLDNGKRSIAVNLKDPKGIKIVRDVAKHVDVLIEPYRKGVMEKLGLGPDILLKDNPRLIYSRLTGYGQNGYYSDRAGHDINYVGLSGILSLFGRKNENPLFPVNLAADFGGGGLTCALGIIMALYERNSSGLGQVIDCSMVEGAAYLGSWFYRSQKLPVWGNKRGENMLDTGTHFYEVYKTKDGKYMTVGALEPQFYDQLLQGLGLSDQVPQFSNYEDNKNIFKEKFLEKTQKEWCQIFDKIDACVAPVLDLKEAHLHEHNNQSFVKTKDGIFPKPAPKLSRTTAFSRSGDKKPICGEHTKEILNWVNYSDEEIKGLQEEGVIECYKQAKL